jgi:hypothetical protein
LLDTEFFCQCNASIGKPKTPLPEFGLNSIKRAETRRDADTLANGFPARIGQRRHGSEEALSHCQASRAEFL